MKTATAFAILSLTLCYIPAVHADTFGSGPNTFDIEFVDIGNPGNDDDTTGNPNPAGKVEYDYRMGTYEISEDMIDKVNTLGGLSITHDNRGPNKPATSVSWFDAAQFINWLNTNSGSTPAYKFNGSAFELWQPGDAGYNPNNLYRNSQAKYILPSVDEWYKAAYYDPSGVYYDYPTGSDTAPLPVASGSAVDTAVYEQSRETGPANITLAGGLSPYGTMGQAGNVFEWEETDFDLMNDSTTSHRAVRGAGWNNHSLNFLSSKRYEGGSTAVYTDVGFRVASITIPEPTTLTLAAFGLLGLCFRRRKRA